MATKTKSTKKQTKTKTNAVNPKKGGIGKSFSLGKILELVKANVVPALAAVAVVAFANAMAGDQLGPDGKEKNFNLTRTAIAGILPVVAGKVLKKWVSPAMVDKIMLWSLGLSLLWSGAKSVLMDFTATKTIVEKASELGAKVSFNKQKGTGAIIKRNVGTGAMPVQRAQDSRSHNDYAMRGTGDVMQGQRAEEFTKQVYNFQRV